MTQVFPISSECPVCHSYMEGYELVSEYCFKQDLDMRPYGPFDIITKCQHCCYVTRNITKSVPKEVKDIVSSDEYKSIFKKKIPEDVKIYLGKAFIDEQRGRKLEEIGYSYLNAAWIYDDLSDEEDNLANKGKLLQKATKYRKIAISYYNRSISTISQIILLDLLRRTGQFKKAEKLLNNPKLMKEFPLIIQQQKTLIEAKDTQKHEIEKSEYSIRIY